MSAVIWPLLKLFFSLRFPVCGKLFTVKKFQEDHSYCPTEALKDQKSQSMFTPFLWKTWFWGFFSSFAQTGKETFLRKIPSYDMCVAFNCYTSVVEAMPRSLHLIIDVSVMSTAVASLEKRWHCSKKIHTFRKKLMQIENFLLSVVVVPYI